MLKVSDGWCKLIPHWKYHVDSLECELNVKVCVCVCEKLHYKNNFTRSNTLTAIFLQTKEGNMLLEKHL